MILNAYAVLVAFLDFLRLVFGCLVIGLGLLTWVTWGSSLSPERRKRLEDHCYLLFSLALLILGLNLVSWPLFYCLLQSYVPEWPGTMCVYGVTQIGAGSLGPARFLPPLLKFLEATKPALVFVSGAWLVLYRINRRTGTAPLVGRILLAVVVLGILAVVDSLAEATYLAIPKKETFLSGGCCTLAFDEASGASRFLPKTLIGESFQPLLATAYYSVNVGMALALGLCLWRLRSCGRPIGLGILSLAALASWPINGLFLIEIAAPTLLHLPYHHCPYDLISEAPDSLVAVAIFVFGSFAVGWAWLAFRLAGDMETRPFLMEEISKLLVMALVGYVSSVVMMTLELALA
jgi:hypothetical protein